MGNEKLMLVLTKKYGNLRNISHLPEIPSFFLFSINVKTSLKQLRKIDGKFFFKNFNFKEMNDKGFEK